MAKETKRLVELFAAKDEAESLLANLEELKVSGAISERQYTTLRDEYEQRLNAATSEIVQIRSVLKKQLETAKRDLETYKFELGRLEVKHKVGELPLNKYQSSERKLRAAIEQLESTTGELKRLVDAKSSSDIGAPSAKKAAAGKEIKLPKTKKMPKAKAAATPSLARVVPVEEGFLKPRTKIAALVGGALLLISVFLPWIAASAKLGKELGSQSGISASIIIGAAGIVFGLVAIGSAFFTNHKARGAVQIVMAVLALAVLPAMVLTGVIPLLSEYARTLVVIREGPYLYAIAAILLIIAGSLELRRH